MPATSLAARRGFLRRAAALGAASALPACAVPAPRHAPRVVVIGAGFGGATAAKYLRLWSGGAIDVVLVDPAARFVSCPLSNLVVGGQLPFDDIVVPDAGLEAHGVRRVRAAAAAVDADRREVVLAGGERLRYDRLVVAPGIDFRRDAVDGLAAAPEEAFPHAWKAGPQTALLARQLAAMPDGGTFVIAIPPAPYRCPPGPYERACLVADALRRRNPRATLIVLDGNPDLVSKGALFRRAWADHGKRIDYRPQSRVVACDARTRTLVTEMGERVRGDVVNLIPPQRAADLAVAAGLVPAQGTWCPVDWLALESTLVPGVHVLGDATLSAPGMPKSGHMANQHGKAAAAAVIARLAGEAPAPPVMVNTCYSFVDAAHAIRVSSVHRYDAASRTVAPVAGAGGVSAAETSQWALEAGYARGWARTIWADTLA